MPVSIRSLVILSVFICSMNIYAEKKMEAVDFTEMSIINVKKNNQPIKTIDDLRRKIEELESRIEKLEEKHKLRNIPLSL